MSGDHIVQLTDERASDAALVGGKVTGLARLSALGARVPPAFAVGVTAFHRWLDSSGNRDRVQDLVDGRRGTGSAAGLGDAIGELLATAAVPPDVAADILAGYRGLAERLGAADPAVAVRSSATNEDSAALSFAGEYDTYLDVVGAEDLLASVVRCWRSCYHDVALSYLLAHDLAVADVGMAVVVQAMVPAAKAGVMFTLSPVTGDRSRIVIEGSWGLGTAIVGGEVTPDRFSVDKVSLAVLSKEVAEKAVEHGPGGRARAVEADRRAVSCLEDREIVELATIGKRLERAHRHPLDIEWAVDPRLEFPDSLMLLQCRPETVWSSRERRTAYDASVPMVEWITSNLTGGKA
jgi:pyruvate, water dikinase